MFQEVKLFISDYIHSLNGKITVDSDVIHNDKKLEYALSVDDYMASLSILDDFTYDFLIVEIDSEKIKINKTLYFDDIGDLFKQIKTDLEHFSELR